MKSLRWLVDFFAVACLFSSLITHASAQSPSVLYTWDNSGNPAPDIEAWIRSFGAANTAATLSNATVGTFSIIENGTALGGSQAFSDGFNRIREAPTGPNGGLDLTGLSSLQFDMGHNGVGPVNVQFYVQASTGSNFVALGPDVAVSPGINTYNLPLTGLTPAQAVYICTIGVNIRDHAAEGNLTWSINEVRSAGTPLTNRVLDSFNNGESEGGLQVALVNFDGASVSGNSGQNQTGLTQNPAGSGSLQWIDLAGGAGGAISVGNGTALNGNTFNNRAADLSNYVIMHVRISATETTTSNGGTLPVQAFFQKNNFSSFQSPGTESLTIDGQFHDLYFSLVGMTDMNVVDQTGLNLGTHTNELRINVDQIDFSMVPEPASFTLIGIALAGCLGLGCRNRHAA